MSVGDDMATAAIATQTAGTTRTRYNMTGGTIPGARRLPK